jgi:hypothetical protein
MTSPGALVPGDVFVSKTMTVLGHFAKLVSAPATIKPFAFWTDASNRHYRLTST